MAAQELPSPPPPPEWPPFVLYPPPRPQSRINLLPDRSALSLAGQGGGVQSGVGAGTVPGLRLQPMPVLHDAGHASTLQRHRFFLPFLVSTVVLVMVLTSGAIGLLVRLRLQSSSKRKLESKARRSNRSSARRTPKVMPISQLCPSCQELPYRVSSNAISFGGIRHDRGLCNCLSVKHAFANIMHMSTLDTLQC